jgi:tetratricopeptide (TPR) repeat protein
LIGGRIARLMLAGAAWAGMPALAQEKGGGPPEPAPEAAYRLLQIGDPAPAMNPAEWIAGTPIRAFEPGQVYVVLFWATHSKWSADALATLAQVQRAEAAAGHPVRCAAVSVWEVALAAPENDHAAVVRKYAEVNGKDWPFAVAYDGDFGEMNQRWMHAADRRWIPSAFVIGKDGKIAWIGHPMDERERLDAVVSQVVAGTWDPAAAAERAKRDATLRESLRIAQRAWDGSMRSGDSAEAMKRCEEMLSGNPSLGNTYLERTLEAVCLRDKKPAEAYAWLGRMADGALQENAAALNTAAWFILDHEGLETRDLDLAMRLAARASEVSKGRTSHIEDTLARAYYEKGDLDKAIEIQTKAVQLAANDAGLYQQLSATLQKYREEKAAKRGEK